VDLQRPVMGLSEWAGRGGRRPEAGLAGVTAVLATIGRHSCSQGSTTHPQEEVVVWMLRGEVGCRKPGAEAHRCSKPARSRFAAKCLQ
jgi:hypothetical protein